MNSPRVAGVLYFVTHVTSVAALVLYGPVLNHPDYVTGPGRDTQILVGGLLEVVLALAVVGTAVALYPILTRYSPGGALGYAALRTLEAATILVGVVTLLGVVTLRQQYAGTAATDTAALTVSGRALVAVHDWTFVIGPGLVVGVNTTVLALALYRFRLVPRFIPVLGLIGGPLVFASNLGVLFGGYTQESGFTAVGAVPVFAWEISLAAYLDVKGIRTRIDEPSGVPTGVAVPALNVVRSESPPLPPDVPAQVCSIVERAMAKDPADRWPSATELAAAARDVEWRDG